MVSDSRAPRHSALEISAAEAKAIDRLVLIRSFRCSRAMLVDGFCLHKKWPLSTLTTRAAAAAALAAAAAAAAQPASSDRTTRRPSSNFLLRWWCSRSSGRGFLSQGMSPSPRPRPRPLAPRLISPLSMSPPLALLLLLHLPSASPAAAAAGARLALLRSSAGLRVWNCCDFHGT